MNETPSLKQLERRDDALAAQVEKQAAKVLKAKDAHDAARAEMARLRAEHKQVRDQLAAARRAAKGPAGAGKAPARAADAEDE